MNWLWFSLILCGTLIYKMIRTEYREHVLNRFGKQLTELMESIVGALRAGSSFYQALTLAVQEAEEPLAGEFQKILKEYHLGKPLEEGLETLCQRVALEDLRSLLAAMRIAQISGGSLANVFQKLAKNLREQKNLKRKAKALAAQGKLQGYIVALLPIFLWAAMNWLDPSLIQNFWAHPVGKMFLSIMLFAQTLAFWIIQKIVKFKI